MSVAAVRHTGSLGGIKTIEDLDRAVKIIGLHDLQLDRCNHELDLEIKKAQNAALIKQAPLKAERDALLATVETYLTANKERVLAGKKSRKLNFGEVGFRKGQPTMGLPAKGTAAMEDVIARILEAAKESPEPFGKIPVHTDNYVLRGDLRDLTDEDLRSIEITRTEGEDRPFVKPNREKLVETAEA